MATYSVDQIIDKTLIAKKPIKVYRRAYDDAEVVQIIQPGQTVGVVYSYLLPGEGRSSFMWTFDDANGKPYYTKHDVGLYDVKALRDAGAITVAEETALAAEANMSTADKIFRYLKYVAILGAGTFIVIALINKNKKNA